MFLWHPMLGDKIPPGHITVQAPPPAVNARHWTLKSGQGQVKIRHSSRASKDLTCWLSLLKVAYCGQNEDVTQSNPVCDAKDVLWELNFFPFAEAVAWLGWESIFPKNLWNAGKIYVQKDNVSQCWMPSYIFFLNTKDVGKGELKILSFLGCCDFKKVALLYMCTQPPSISKHRSVVVTYLLGGLLPVSSM